MPATNRAGHGPGPWPAAVLAALAIALAGLPGCDGSDDAASETTATQPTPARGSADPQVVKRIPLGSTVDQVVAQVGRPARIDRPPAPKGKKSKKAPAQTCYVYSVPGGRPTDQIRMCFVAGKLHSVLALTPRR